ALRVQIDQAGSTERTPESTDSAQLTPGVARSPQMKRRLRLPGGLNVRYPSRSSSVLWESRSATRASGTPAKASPRRSPTRYGATRAKVGSANVESASPSA